MKRIVFAFYILSIFSLQIFALEKNSFVSLLSKNDVHSYNPININKTLVPLAPVLLSPPTNDTLKMNDTALVWQSVLGATSYHVQIAIDSSLFTIVVEDTSIAGDTLLSLQPLIGTKLRVGAKYFWRVSAVDNSGKSPYSEVWSFIPVPLNQFVPGAYWYDTNGNLIEAHGGGMLYVNSSKTYYWYGEYRNASDKSHAIGISCYSSKNLYNWKFEGIVLSDSATNADGNTPVLERPKVIYNDSTHKYVMWMHIDAANYSAAEAGVAVSDKPTGPFKYLGAERPNGQMSRDMTVFKDDNGKAYLIYSSENNATMDASLLTDDYLHQSGTYARILINQSREAPAMFKYNNKYYLITSGTSGWAPNAAKFAVANSVLGPWTLEGNPCIGPNANVTFGGQSTYVLPVQGKPGEFIFMADKWNPNNLPHSTYIWLPLKVDNGKLTIHWYDNWELSSLGQLLGVNYNINETPQEFAMSQNYPNPFNPTTRIRYQLPVESNVILQVYNALGEKIIAKNIGMLNKGNHEQVLNMDRFASGVYFYRIRVSGINGDRYTSVKKMELLK